MDLLAVTNVQEETRTDSSLESLESSLEIDGKSIPLLEVWVADLDQKHYPSLKKSDGAKKK